MKMLLCFQHIPVMDEGRPADPFPDRQLRLLEVLVTEHNSCLHGLSRKNLLQRDHLLYSKSGPGRSWRNIPELDIVCAQGWHGQWGEKQQNYTNSNWHSIPKPLFSEAGFPEHESNINCSSYPSLSCQLRGVMFLYILSLIRLCYFENSYLK